MSTADRVKKYIIDELGYRGPHEDLDENYPILENEVLDSMGIMQVVSFLESEFDVEIDDEDLVPDNFGTIGSIANLVDSK